LSAYVVGNQERPVLSTADAFSLVTGVFPDEQSKTEAHLLAGVLPIWKWRSVAELRSNLPAGSIEDWPIAFPADQ
jgi:hypothetical protein